MLRRLGSQASRSGILRFATAAMCFQMAAAMKLHNPIVIRSTLKGYSQSQDLENEARPMTVVYIEELMKGNFGNLQFVIGGNASYAKIITDPLRVFPKGCSDARKVLADKLLGRFKGCALTNFRRALRACPSTEPEIRTALHSKPGKELVDFGAQIMQNVAGFANLANVVGSSKAYSRLLAAAFHVAGVVDTSKNWRFSAPAAISEGPVREVFCRLRKMFESHNATTAGKFEQALKFHAEASAFCD